MNLEYVKSLPVYNHYDILVAGSGPAGICAAVAAAREGASVCLIERYGVVGGNLTVGHVGPVLGMVGKGTMRDELVRLLGIPDNDMIGVTGVAHDFEKAKIELTRFVTHPQIEILLQTVVVDTLMAGKSIKGLVCSGKEGPFAVTGGIVIDASGDGDVACLAGAPVMKGREDGLMQPVTLEFTIDGVDEDNAIVCIGDVDDVELNGERFLSWCERQARSGLIPEKLAAIRLHRTSRPGQRQVNTTQVNGIDATIGSSLFKAESELRNQIDLLIAFLRNNLPGYENCYCISSASTLGVRESRRIRGHYLLTAEECIAGKKFSDVMVHNAEFIVDIHNPEGAGQAEDKIQGVRPYDIPYGCFVPLNVDNLYVAGRCISGTHRAHASYRIMSVCMAMGQAVGVAAALCCRNQCSPDKLDVSEVQDRLTELGIELYS